MKSLRFRLFILGCGLAFLPPLTSKGWSATWSKIPSSGDWDTATNWVPNTVPNSPTDIATFGSSNLTNVFSDSTFIHLDSLVFSSKAPGYTINLDVSELVLHGAGLVNNSGSVQTIDGAILLFYGNSSAGNMISYNTPAGLIEFYGGSSAGSATFALSTTDQTAFMVFYENSTAGDATINVSRSSTIWFRDTAHGGNATFNLTSAASMFFFDSNSAEHMTANCIGGDQYSGSGTKFQGASSAGEGSFTTIGASAGGEKGGDIEFDNSATADHAAFVINGGLGSGLAGTTLSFSYHTTAAEGTFVINGGTAINTAGGTMYLRGNATAANATITVNGGTDSGGGGMLIFEGRSSGGSASVSVFENGELAIGHHLGTGISIGSLAGDGLVFLGNDNVPLDTHYLTIGSNNQNSAFTGLI